MTFDGHITFADLAPVANHLWQSTLCIGVIWLATLILRKNRAAVRYWLWFAASVKFLIPFSLLVSIGSRLAWRSAPDIAQPQWSFVMDNVASPFAGSIPVVQGVAPHGSLPIPAILIGVWLCGFAAGIVFWVRGLHKMRAVRRLATPLALGLPIPAMSSPSRIEPGVFGILRPVLLLPEGIADRLTAPQLDAILAHEMCHVRRRDNLTAAIHMFVETVFWLHPLLWWIRTRLIEERERACDEEVVRFGADPETYAEGIISVCKSYIESPVACVSGISGSDLKKRIVRIMTLRLGQNLTFGRKLLLAAVGIATVASPIVFGLANAPLLHAQAPTHDWQTVAGGKRAFDVASVKLNKSGLPPSGNTPYSNIPLGDGAVYSPTGGLLSTTNYQLSLYIAFAYKLTANDTKSLMSQLPKWAIADRFDIQARAEGNPTQDQMRLMMQSLLADRFKLAIHRETRQVPVFAAVLLNPEKTGPQLQEHRDDASCSTAPSSPSATGSAGAPSVTVAGGFPATCGGLVRLPASTSGRMRMGARNLTMGLIASWLTAMGSLDRPVLDQTGLSGNFDFFLEWAPEFNGPPPPGVDFQPDATGATFLEAVKDQLGLKLESRTGPVDVLVVDHIEEPSAN